MSEIKEKERVPAQSEYESQRSEHLALATTAHKMANEIQTDQQYVDASEFLIKIKERRRWWEKLINPAIEAAHAAHKRMIAVKKEVDLPLERAENEILKPALLKYSAKKEAERKAAEEQVNKMLAEEAEKKRKAEEEARAKTALLDGAGQPLPPAEPVEPPPVVPTIVLPKTEEPKGISYVTTYAAEVVDFKALVKAVVDGTVPEDAIMPNMSFLNNRAKVLKNLLNWPGVAVKEERNVRATSGR